MAALNRRWKWIAVETGVENGVRLVCRRSLVVSPIDAGDVRGGRRTRSIQEVVFAKDDDRPVALRDDSVEPGIANVSTDGPEQRLNNASEVPCGCGSSRVAPVAAAVRFPRLTRN